MYGLLASEDGLNLIIARACVEVVPPAVEKLGGTPEQAQVLKEAFTSMLVSKIYEIEAKEKLEDAGFEKSDIERIMGIMREGYASLS
jgi:hypothetical protein